MANPIEPVFRIYWYVTAYDEVGLTGYGENCSQEFPDEPSAVKYAMGLEERFGAVVHKNIEMQKISIPVPLPKK